jgi:F-type H+-transporting ATPase subunit b
MRPWILAAVTEDEEHHIDRTHHWLWPEGAEILYGLIATAIVILLFWKLGVFKMIAKAFHDRTAKVQKQLDDSTTARATAEAEAADIRRAAGDIESERARLLAEADAQAETLLADGRVRLEAEVAELDARADAEIASAATRTSDELHAEIARLSGAAAEHLVAGSLDEATHQRLIEDFITKVGASA